jgi:hypothetical protein
MRSQLSTILDYLHARWVNFSAEELSQVLGENVCLVYGDGGIGTKQAVVEFLLFNDLVKPFDGHRMCNITEFHILQQKTGNLKLTYAVVESDLDSGFSDKAIERTEELEFTPDNLIKAIAF